MTRSARTRLLAPLALAATLGLGILPAAAPAQEPEPEAGAEGESKGRPLDGYFAAGAIAGLALFLVGKSARR